MGQRSGFRFGVGLKPTRRLPQVALLPPSFTLPLKEQWRISKCFLHSHNSQLDTKQNAYTSICSQRFFPFPFQHPKHPPTCPPAKTRIVRSPLCTAMRARTTSSPDSLLLMTELLVSCGTTRTTTRIPTTTMMNRMSVRQKRVKTIKACGAGSPVETITAPPIIAPNRRVPGKCDCWKDTPHASKPTSLISVSCETSSCIIRGSTRLTTTRTPPNIRHRKKATQQPWKLVRPPWTSQPVILST